MSLTELPSVIAMHAMKALYDDIAANESYAGLVPAAKEALLSITTAARDDIYTHAMAVTPPPSKQEYLNDQANGCRV